MQPYFYTVNRAVLSVFILYFCAMYLYNVSIILEENSHTNMLEWLNSQWIPQLPAKARFLKMLNSPHEGHTYCIHLMVENEDEIHAFHSSHIQMLQDYITQHHKEKVFLFDSVMQYLDC